MFGSMKKALAVGAVVTMGAFAAPAMASAGWSPAGAQTAEGVLSITVDANGVTTQCNDVTAEISLNATGYGGTVSELNLDDCSVTTTGFGACIVNASATASPTNLWGLTGNPLGTVEIEDVVFTNQYTGAGCPLNGLTAQVGGAVEGDYDNLSSTLEFTDAPGLESLEVGTVVVNGQLEISNGVQLT